jgi:glycosyltransferase involved in cell wall biosynthesis
MSGAGSSVGGPALSVLIRCRDEERRIGALIETLRGQSIGERIELLVLDSGSRDGTSEELRARGIEPLRIAPADFTYGGALNLLAGEARAELCVALSAHAMPPDLEWATRMVGAFEDERVACAFGERVGTDLSPLSAPLLQDRAHADAHPHYGYSNSAGGFRRALWERRPFSERLEASEDKEWAWHWLGEGWLVRLDPALAVRHSHRDEGPVRTFRRARADFGATREFRRVPPVELGELLSEWWRGPHGHRSSLRARLDPRRIAALAGKYAGLRGER